MQNNPFALRRPQLVLETCIFYFNTLNTPNVRIYLVLKGDLQSWFPTLLFGLSWAQIPNKVSELVSGGLVALIITMCLLCVNFADSKGLRKEAHLTFHPSSTCNL